VPIVESMRAYGIEWLDCETAGEQQIVTAA
jgi:hypothetical protein